VGGRHRALENNVTTASPGAGPVDRDFWRKRRVLVTGHTGFIGGWASAWLCALGSEVAGISLPPPTDPSFHGLVGLKSRVNGVVADVRSPAEFARAYEAARPDVVLHLAAQPLVRIGYEQPDETFAVNLMGTVNLLDCVRRHGAKAVVVMTSDKVYGPGDGRTLHREGDALGAHDPYGGSKACCELAVDSYAHSFLSGASVGSATVRAGNVLGGGDWQVDRLIPDAVRAFSTGQPLVLRYPEAVRPWQHVLDAVQGLLVVAQETARWQTAIGPWNIGPLPDRTVTVGALGDMIAAAWGGGARVTREGTRFYPETHILAIDGSKARSELGVVSPWNLEAVVERTVDWYKGALAGQDAWQLAMDQIETYQADCARAPAAARG
jgi:CDP-glucose 4,6-dehydratase